MPKYVTNPNKRCSICDGREVITIEDDGSAHGSLSINNGNYYCIDREECKQNVIAENTEINFYEDKIKVTQFGEEIVSVEKNKK